MTRTQVFLSYAHQDERWKHKLYTHLQVLVQAERIELWCDRDIRPGQQWVDEIDQRLLSAKVGLLVISPDFLSSEFVMRHEVPLLLKKHEENGLHLIPILLRQCVWETVDWLRPMQIVPRDAKSVAEFPKSKVDRVLADIAREVLKAVEQ